MNQAVLETIQSVLTPDAGHVNTIAFDPEKANDQYSSTSISRSWLKEDHAIRVTYENGDIVIIPYTNIRYIYEPVSQVENKKDSVHLKSPFKKVNK